MVCRVKDKGVAILSVFLGLFMLFVLSVGFSSGVLAGDTIEAEVNIYVPAEVIEVEVPDKVNFGNLTLGFNEESDKVKVEINNSGNVDVVITPELVEEDDIFENLYFARRTTDSYEQIGNWSIEIEKPEDFGGVEDDYFYVKLDLRDAALDLSDDLIDYKKDVRFIAVKA